MKISIALATYNGSRYLQAQLDSFLNQTRLPDELVVCDDCSTDGTFEILELFSRQAPFIVHIYRNETNLGYTKNFEKALSICIGDIILLSDQDDVWLPTKLDDFAAKFESEPDLQVLIHDLEYCKEDLTPIGQTKIERMTGFYDLDRDYVVGMATAIRGPFLRICLPFPDEPHISHDKWLHQCAHTIRRKKILHQVLALYRRHSSNATSNSNLNVDFVTSPSHFKPSIQSLFNRLKAKTKLPSTRYSPLCEWLQRNRSELLKGCYTTTEFITDFISKKSQRILHTKAREEILSSTRINRIRPVITLLRRGGYQHFKGWKSAIKDLFLN